MVAPFKGKRNEYQCPFCGRYASERNRYCSECFLVNPDQPGKPRSINVLMKPPHSNKPIAMVQLIAAVVVGILLGMGAFMIWDKYQPGTIPFTFKKDTSDQRQEQNGESLLYEKPPTPPWVSSEKAETPTPPWASIEKVDNSKPAVPNPGQPEAQTDQKGINRNDAPEANEFNLGNKAKDPPDKSQNQMGQEGTVTDGTSATGEKQPTKPTQTDPTKEMGDSRGVLEI